MKDTSIFIFSMKLHCVLYFHRINQAINSLCDLKNVIRMVSIITPESISLLPYAQPSALPSSESLNWTTVESYISQLFYHSATPKVNNAMEGPTHKKRTNFSDEDMLVQIEAVVTRRHVLLELGNRTTTQVKKNASLCDKRGGSCCSRSDEWK